MNIEALKQLREFERDRAIDMDWWLKKDGKDLEPRLEQHACATAGCHGGWLMVMTRTSVSTNASIFAAAQTLLNLTYSEAQFLLAGDSHFNYKVCDELEARARLDYLIANGRVPQHRGDSAWMADTVEVELEAALTSK